MKKSLAILLAVVMALLLASPAFCSLGWKKNGVPIGAVADLNLVGQAGGTTESYDGSTLTLYEGGAQTGTSTIVSTVSKLSAANLAFGVLSLSGAAKTFSMSAGNYVGQEVTLVRADMDARALVLKESIDNPAVASTGWSSVTFSTTTANSSVTLVWVDATVGWIITGSYNVTIA